MNIDVIINKIFKSYCNEILIDILPNQQVQGTSSSNTLEKIHLISTNSAYRNSAYYVSVENKKFIHFTNLEKLNNILLGKAFHLYDLNFVDDKNEIQFPLQQLKSCDDILKKVDVNKLRKQILSISFCDAEIDEIVEYNMWRLYGKGIAIEFSFENDESQWDSFHLSKIYYNENKLLNDIKNTCTKFNVFFDELIRESDYQKGNLYSSFLNQIISLLAFHKVNIFKSEMNLD
ncbi:MAG: hypothetical protein ABJA35_01290 [Parafilimonas sp.]